MDRKSENLFMKCCNHCRYSIYETCPYGMGYEVYWDNCQFFEPEEDDGDYSDYIKEER